LANFARFTLGLIRKLKNRAPASTHKKVVIVLANNRRVDVALSTTGQQSVRQYPFNARDALTLLSTKGGEKSQPPRKKKP